MQAIPSKIDRRRYWHSSSFKMALLFTLLLGGCVGILSYFSYYFNYGNFVAHSGAIIDREIATLVKLDRKDLYRLLDSHTGDTDKIYLLRGPDQKPLAGNIIQLPDKVKVLKEGTLVFEEKHRMYAVKIHLFDDGATLAVGVDITETAHAYFVMQLLSILSIVLMALVILTSFVISTFVVNRTNRIAITAKKIMDTGDLSQRIAVDSHWDDLSHMTFVLNAFLERVQHLMTGVRQVSDNIAHDLKTPLTRLHNNIEQMKNRSDLLQDKKLASICDKMTAETSRLLDTFNALLRIARVEAGDQRKNFKPVDTAKILGDVIELYEPLAQKKEITLSLTTEDVALRQGDPDLLFQALANIIDNAIKFTPHNGHITVNLTNKQEAIFITVQDTGPGIPECDKPRIFDRFYRADSSRTTEGNGLGLALVAAVIELHKGKIYLHDALPGLRMEVIL